jgi:hypothetical protein
MDKHERAAASARIAQIEQAFVDLPKSGVSPAEQAKRGLALQGEWMELSKILMEADRSRLGPAACGAVTPTSRRDSRRIDTGGPKGLELVEATLESARAELQALRHDSEARRCLREIDRLIGAAVLLQRSWAELAEAQQSKGRFIVNRLGRRAAVGGSAVLSAP